MVAAFGANNVTARVWTQTEIALVRGVAERTWEAVERARAESALRERERRFRLALSASGGGSWSWDAHTNHVDWDDAFRARFGFARTNRRCSRPGSPTSTLTTASRSTRPRSEFHARTRGITPTGSSGADGTVLWMQSLGRADRDGAGQVTRLTGLELDVTERRARRRRCRRDATRSTIASCGSCWKRPRRASSRSTPGYDRDGESRPRSDVWLGSG